MTVDSPFINRALIQQVQIRMTMKVLKNKKKYNRKNKKWKKHTSS